MNNTVKFNKLGIACVTFFKWDYGQVLCFESVPADSEVHFPINGSADTVTVKVVDNKCNIPDSTLTLDKSSFDAWLYIDNGAAGRTKKTIHFTLIQRAKPDDHIYNPNDHQMLDYKNKLDKFQSIENAGKHLVVDSDGYISFADLKTQFALNGGRLKDIAVVQNEEELEGVYTNIETAFEEWQNGDYALLIYGVESDGEDNSFFGVMTISKENDEFVDKVHFVTMDMDEKIKDMINPLKKEIEALQPTIDKKQDLSFTLNHNCEYRRPECKFLGGYVWLQLQLPSNIPDDYISSLVFNSGATARTLSYPQEIIFTGDDVIDNVFVPAANKTYNVMFWYDGVNVNAVARGVPYAEE